MDASEYTNALQNSSLERLSKIIGINSGDGEVWQPEDRSALLENQLSAPILFDLSDAECGADEAKREKTLSSAHDARSRTFRELFAHKKPPLALLDFAKNFFKTGAGTASQRDPGQEVAYVMYLICIVTARNRHNTRISSLKDGDILKSLRWVSEQSWVNDEVRSQMLDAVGLFQSGKKH
jgi:hypothetical protein